MKSISASLGGALFILFFSSTAFAQPEEEAPPAKPAEPPAPPGPSVPAREPGAQGGIEGTGAPAAQTMPDTKERLLRPRYGEDYYPAQPKEDGLMTGIPIEERTGLRFATASNTPRALSGALWDKRIWAFSSWAKGHSGEAAGTRSRFARRSPAGRGASGRPWKKGERAAEAVSRSRK